jgi:hypothetical protein
VHGRWGAGAVGGVEGEDGLRKGDWPAVLVWGIETAGLIERMVG